MSSVKLAQLPSELQIKVINSSDTNAIDVATAATGKIVRVWGFSLVGGTSVLFGSNATALSGVITTSGWLMSCPRGNPADAAYPIYESAVGETIKVTPGASGLNGTLYYTQD